MDPVTNSLVGFTVSRTGLGRLTPLGEVAIVLGANLPDLDWLSLAISKANIITFIGGPLHSLAVAPALAITAAAVVWLLAKRKASLAKLSLLALTGVLARLALDVTNVSGVQLLYPFDARWFHLDLMPWFDPWLLMLLIAFAFWPWISHLVNVELGIREVAGRGLAFVTLLLALGYIGYRGGNYAEAMSTIPNHSYGGEIPIREACFPDTFSIVRMRCVVETENQFANIDYFVGDYFDATEAQILKRQNRPVWQVAQFQSSYYQQLERRLRMSYWTVFPADYPEGAKEAVMHDLILAPEPYPLFRLRVLLDKQERMLEEALVIQTQDFGRFEDTRTP